MAVVVSALSHPRVGQLSVLLFCNNIPIPFGVGATIATLGSVVASVIILGVAMLVSAVVSTPVSPWGAKIKALYMSFIVGVVSRSFVLPPLHRLKF